jgi:hypothetical protein
VSHQHPAIHYIFILSKEHSALNLKGTQGLFKQLNEHCILQPCEVGLYQDIPFCVLGIKLNGTALA